MHRSTTLPLLTVTRACNYSSSARNSPRGFAPRRPSPSRPRPPVDAVPPLASLGPSQLSAVRLDYLRERARAPTQLELERYLPEWHKRTRSRERTQQRDQLERDRRLEHRREQLDLAHEWDRQQSLQLGIQRTPKELRDDQRRRERIDQRLRTKLERERLKHLEAFDRLTLKPEPPATPEIEIPDWKKHKLAIKSRFPSGWAPPKRISREAMDLVRTLHRVDPSVNSVSVLSERFKISPEAVRRVLKSRFELDKDERDRRERRRKELRERDVVEHGDGDGGYSAPTTTTTTTTWSGDRARERGEMQRLRDRRRNDRPRPGSD